MNRIIRFFKTAGVYFIGNVFTKLISFFLLPLYTKRINPEDYGEYGLIYTILNVAVPIAFFAIWDSVFRFSFDYKDEKDKYVVLNNGVPIIISGIILTVLGTVIAYQIFHFSFPIIICIYSISMGFQYYYTSIARAFKDNNLFVLSGVINSLVSIVLNIILIVTFGMGVESLYISYIVGVLFQVIIIEKKIRFFKNISFSKINFSVIKTYLKFSIPVTVSAISNWLLNGLTQLYITDHLGKYYNGLYNVANKFSSILILGFGVFQFAWNEMAYELATDKEQNKVLYYKKSISEILRMSILGVSLLLLLVKIVYPIMVDKQYSESLIVVPILLVGTMANSYSGFLGTLFLADKKSFSLFTTTLAAGIINYIGLHLLVAKYHFVGGVLSLCLSFIFYALIRLIILKYKFKVTPYCYSFIPLIVLVISILSFYLIESLFISIVVFLCLVFVSVYIIKDLFLYGLKIVSSKRKKSGEACVR